MVLEDVKYDFHTMDELIYAVKQDRERYRLDIKEHLINNYLLEEIKADKMSQRIVNKY